MANAWYKPGLDRLLDAYLTGTRTAGTATLKLVGVGVGYVYDSQHSVLADLGANTVTSLIDLENPDVSDGSISSDDLLPAFSGAAPGTVLHGLILVAVFPSQTHLMAFINESTDSSIPVSIGGSDINIRWVEGFVAKLG
jgi:hypothetical protein